MKASSVRQLLVIALAFGFGALALMFPLSAMAGTPAGNRSAPASLNSYGCLYTVRYGDTLSGIAMRYRVSTNTMMAYNGWYSPNLIYAGMAMRVPCSASYPTTSRYGMPSYSPYSRGAYGTYLPSTYSVYGSSSICAYHRVLWGEDLYRIALRYGMSWPTLAAANHLNNPNLIYAGMILAIPCSYSVNGYYAPPGNNYNNNQSSPSYAPQNNYSQGSQNNYGQNPKGGQMTPTAPQATPAPSSTSTPAQSTSVTIQDFSFSPATITIHAGQTVTWTNNGPSMHTVTSNTGAFDSGTLNAGASYSHTFSSTGTFAYHCSIHPMMMGTVVVVP